MRTITLNGIELKLIESEAQIINDTLYLTFTSSASINDLDTLFKNKSMTSSIKVMDSEDEGYAQVYANYTDYRALYATMNDTTVRYEVQLGYLDPTENILKILAGSIEVKDKPTDDNGVELPYKAGYKWIQQCIWSNGAPVIQWEQVVDEDYISENDGSDYTKPITYKAGMSVVKGLWYTDGTDVWECIKDGTPLGFDDKDYFDIIEA